jgi:GMP reductase
MNQNTALYYNQIISIPRKCIVKSRSECDTSIDFCGYKFALPVLPANMASVVSEDTCKWLSFNNYFYIYHRFSNTRSFISRSNFENWPLVSISIGVQPSDTELIDWLEIAKYRVDFITIDVAHGFTDSVAVIIKYIKNKLPNTKVIAGNIWGDKESVKFLQDAGADALKVGLSCGAGCSTFNQTSFGSPMFTAALQAGYYAKIPVILDGGVREAGDIARAMIGFMSNQGEYSYGGVASKIYKNGVNIPMIMIGSLFAACIDAPGDIITYSNTPQKRFKKYYGSASAESKQKTGQEVKHIEGKSIEIPCNEMTYSEYYASIKQAVQSQISYGGGKDLTCFKDVEWRVIS